MKNKLADKIDEIKRLYVQEKKTMLEIAAHFEVTAIAVRLRLIKMGVRPRNQGRPPKLIKCETLIRLHLVE